jgi:hypothetical protein
VFDTLLHRNISPPDQVWVPSAKILCEILNAYKIKRSVASCLRVRGLIVQELQRVLSKAGKDAECHIKNIIQVLLINHLVTAAYY